MYLYFQEDVGTNMLVGALYTSLFLWCVSFRGLRGHLFIRENNIFVNPQKNFTW